MGKIYFLTECDPDLPTGGAIIRRGTINYLRKNNFSVVVVKPGESFKVVDENTYTIPGFSVSKVYYALEALGLVADKYFIWSNNLYKYMKNIIDKDDIIFATTGGALSAVIAGIKLKIATGAKLIVNYHDPTDFTSLGNGFSRNSRFFHINRDFYERKLIKRMDYIVTSSEAYKSLLVNKYPGIADKIECNYFGYIKESNYVKKQYEKTPSPLNIVYGGNMGTTQSPEILAEAIDGLEGVTATFIGNYKANANLMRYVDSKNIALVDSLSMDEYFRYLYNKADLGFFSLRNNLTNYCIPSKFFDYVNLGLPMVAVVGGDARDLIIQNEYGIVSSDSSDELRSKIIEIRDNGYLPIFQKNVLEDKQIWSMNYRIKQLVDLIKKL
ncbi:MAG TPA: glycosyltransferase [Macellibacteroides fermentans]|uniref:glycosyltransferase n=1 Tax=Macellibacteroides fermentans TaxID=879969 RepID=UPI002C2C92DA|nr:glycosyltransferase [Macellibacteroides fermentans]